MVMLRFSRVFGATLLMITVCFVCLGAETQYGGGTGEPNTPYLIYTAEQMNEIGLHEEDWNKHFKLMTDIDMIEFTGTALNIIGYSEKDLSYWGSYPEPGAFCGVFDGDDHTISNISYVYQSNGRQYGYVGLFGFVDHLDAVIKNLRLVGAKIDGGSGDGVGALVGKLESGAVRNCHVETSTISGQHLVGGLVGYSGGTITSCSVDAEVSGESNVGGLCGHSDGSISECHAEGIVSGGSSIGGLVGVKSGRITESSFEGYVTGEINIGGLVGFKHLSLYYCYAHAIVSGCENVGGLVGYHCCGTTGDCYATGHVTGETAVGGLTGFLDTLVPSVAYPGEYYPIIANCYATATVEGQTQTGGLVGTLDPDDLPPIYDSFWDIETSRQTTSAGGTGQTTVDMQTASTFLEAGWDFSDETLNGTEDIWWILEGQDYPRLWWQYGRAFSPYPQDGAVNVPQPLTLSWLSGGLGLYHDVYFGEEKEAVANATIESPGIYRGRQEPEITYYNPGNLELVKTYYWRIDEINEADHNSPWKGNLWSFTMADFIVVDDFENYDSDKNYIWYSWNDGLGYGVPGIWITTGNFTGSAVGDETTPSYTEETIVHGGMQSMPYWYDNDKVGYAKYSEAEKTLIYPRDWTEEGVSELSLCFHGRSDFVGSFVEEPAGVFTISSSGTDIGGGRDQFHFAYKSLTGPGSIVARIESIKNTHEWAKAGLMIRQGLHEISQYTFVCVTPGNGIVFQGSGGVGPETSFATNQTGIIVPLWLKLERGEAGNFTASHSVNGTNWQPVQNSVPMNISMSSNAYIGLALTAHNADATCQAVFSNVTITGTVSEQWEHQDIGIVNNDPEPLYVAVTNRTGMPAVIYHDDPNVVRIDTWTEWVIPLQMFANQGIDLTDVDRIAIGIGTRGNRNIPGGQGKMYFDDIRLYQSRSVASNDLEVIIP